MRAVHPSVVVALQTLYHGRGSRTSARATPPPLFEVNDKDASSD